MKKFIPVLLVGALLYSCVNTNSNKKEQTKSEINLDLVNGEWILTGQENNQAILSDSSVFVFKKYMDAIADLTFYTADGKLKLFTSSFEKTDGNLNFDVYLNIGDKRTLSITQVDSNNLTMQYGNNVFHFNRLQGTELAQFKDNVEKVKKIEATVLPYKIVERKDVSYLDRKKDNSIVKIPRKSHRVVLEVNQVPEERELNKAYGVSQYKRDGSFITKINETALHGTKWLKK